MWNRLHQLVLSPSCFCVCVSVLDFLVAFIASSFSDIVFSLSISLFLLEQCSPISSDLIFSRWCCCFVAIVCLCFWFDFLSALVLQIKGISSLLSAALIHPFCSFFHFVPFICVSDCLHSCLLFFSPISSFSFASFCFRSPIRSLCVLFPSLRSFAFHSLACCPLLPGRGFSLASFSFLIDFVFFVSGCLHLPPAPPPLGPVSFLPSFLPFFFFSLIFFALGLHERYFGAALSASAAVSSVSTGAATAAAMISDKARSGSLHDLSIFPIASNTAPIASCSLSCFPLSSLCSFSPLARVCYVFLFVFHVSFLLFLGLLFSLLINGPKFNYCMRFSYPDPSIHADIFHLVTRTANQLYPSDSGSQKVGRLPHFLFLGCGCCCCSFVVSLWTGSLKVHSLLKPELKGHQHQRCKERKGRGSWDWRFDVVMMFVCLCPLLMSFLLSVLSSLSFVVLLVCSLLVILSDHWILD